MVEKKKKKKNEEDDKDIYTKEGREEEVDNDEISDVEEAVVEGFEE